MLNSDWLKTKLRLIVQDLRLIVTFMQRAQCSHVVCKSQIRVPAPLLNIDDV